MSFPSLPKRAIAVLLLLASLLHFYADASPQVQSESSVGCHSDTGDCLDKTREPSSKGGKGPYIVVISHVPFAAS